MQIKLENTLNNGAQTVIIPVFETENEVVFNEIKILKEIFSAKKDTQYITEKNSVVYYFIGLGKNAEYKTIENGFRRIINKNKNVVKENTSIIIDENFTHNQIEAALVGFITGSYKLSYFKESDNNSDFLDSITLSVISSKDIQNIINKSVKIAKAKLDTFALVDLPSNKITPNYLADWAINLKEIDNVSVSIFNKDEALQQELFAFLAVSQGSANEPKFIIIDYHPQNAKKHIGLVGKGITFDTGGLNIKTQAMVHMKCDMAGAAAVFGTMQLVANLALPHRVTAIVPACENAIDANSYKPSDVIKSYSRKTIEIIDTDAEGRLILADGLSYLIKNYKPEVIIDMATLTGSSVATFGNECAALFSNNNDLVNKIQEAGEMVGEKSWQLPLWDTYKPDIESEIADVKNYSGKPVAGAISAAKFLEFFTENHPCWAHLDIAGVAFIDDEFAKTKHATAYGVQLLTKFIENY